MSVPPLLPRRVRVRRLSAVAALVLSAPAHAQNLGRYVELEAASVRNSSSSVGGSSSSTRTERFAQRYRLAYTSSLSPTVRLVLGGHLERDDARVAVEAPRTSSSFTRIRPEALISLTTPLVRADAGFNVFQESIGSGLGPTVTDVREQLSANARYAPAALPALSAGVLRTHSFDRERSVRDLTDDLLQLGADYRPFRQVRLEYRGVRERVRNHLSDDTVRNRSDTGRAAFGDTWLGGRVSVSADYLRTRRETRGGELVLIALAGLAALDETPEEGLLDTTSSLVDGNRTAPAGVDLGVVAPGGDARPRNLGLDLGREMDVESLLVTIDRDLPPDLSATFSFRVYTSFNGRLWTPVEAPPAVEFDAVRLRFVVRVARVTTRYLKLVTRPLSAAAAGADRFPSIAVTELEAALDEEGADRDRDTTLYNAAARTRLLARPFLYHEITYYVNRTDADEERIRRLSNGLSLSQAFGTRASASARLAREDGTGEGVVPLTYVYTAALSAALLPALRQDVVWSGRRETDVDARRSDHTLLLNTVASLYRGIDVTVGVGTGRNRSPEQGTTRNTQWNANAALTPHRVVSFGLAYQDTQANLGFAGQPPYAFRAAEATFNFHPFPALYLFGGHRFERRTGARSRSANDLALGWLPFARGTLHFNFRYDESYQSESDSKQRSISPSLRWSPTQRLFLDLSFQNGTAASDIESTRNQVIRATLRYGE